MTAKIKLNAASGGGSISINAPSSAGSDTDLLDTSGNLSLTGNCKVGTITDTSGNNSSTTQQINKGRCKAFVFFDDSGTIKQANSTDQAFNVSSVTDNGSSEYTINFATAFVDSEYMPVVQCSQNDDGRCAISNTAYNTASACKMFTRSDFTAGRSDANNNMVTIWSVV